MSFDMSLLSYLIHSHKTKLTLGVPRVYPSTTPGQHLKPKRTDSVLATGQQEELPTPNSAEDIDRRLRLWSETQV